MPIGARHARNGWARKITSRPKKRRTIRTSPENGKSLRTTGVIVCPVPGSTTKKRRWVNISSATVGRKQPTIKCSRRAEKSSSRKAESLDPGRGRDSKSNGGRAISLAAGFFTGREPACALSRSSEFHRQVGRKSRAGRLRRAINAGRQPDEMAPRAYQLVFRDLHLKKMGAGLSRCRSGVRVSIQLLLQRRRRDASPRPPWIDLAADG